MAHSPIALPPALPSELLTWILNHSDYPTAILICKPRAAFLSSLLADISSNTSPPPASSNDIPSSPPNPTTTSAQSQTPSHPLLLKTLHQISLSRHISLIYIPTTSHLRAYLSVLSTNTPSKVKAPPDGKWDKAGRKRAMIVVYGLVELHRGTSEWSAQGLSRSLAALVEMSGRERSVIVCLEEREREFGRSGAMDVDDEDEDGSGGENNDGGGVRSDETVRRKERLLMGWDEKVPMLNGSVRRTGLEGEDNGWSGRTIEVGRIFARWFDFENAKWDHCT